MRNHFVVVILVLLFPFNVISQKVEELTIGDKCPDFEIKNLINYSNTSVKLSDFKGKLVILDFFEVWCGSCLESLPKLDSLQKVYGKELQIITVTRADERKRIENRLKSIKVTKGINLPIVIRDESLFKYFPHKEISHIVWIDGNGIVKAITGAEYVTNENIKIMLSGISVNWPVKIDAIDFDYKKPVLEFDNNTDVVKPYFLYYSALMGHLGGVTGSNKYAIDTVNNLQILNYFNLPLVQLCRLSIENAIGGLNRKRLVLEVKDSSRYLYNKSIEYYNEWSERNTYCYSLTLPINILRPEIRRIEREDLSHWLKVLFGVTAKKEKRLVECLVLTRFDLSDSLLITKGGEMENTFLENNSKIKKMVNCSFASFTGFLNAEWLDIPIVIDETGILPNRRVDIQIQIEAIENIPELQKELLRYGLILIESKREIEMYVISEKI